MDSVYGQDVAMSIDMDELGVRPLNWIDISKDFDDSINDYFGKEKTVDFTVYSAELQLTNNGKKLTTDEEDDPFMSNDDDSQDYEIDPETGIYIYKVDSIFRFLVKRYFLFGKIGLCKFI